MAQCQQGILLEPPKHSRYLSFDCQSGVSTEQIKSTLSDLAELVDGKEVVLGIGLSLLNVLGVKIEGLRHLSATSGAGFDIPSTPAALWCWLRGDDPGELYHRSRRLEEMLFPAFSASHVLYGFLYKDSRDLSGYEDGTENPQGDDAIAAAIVSGQGNGMDGSSFVAVQQWLHDFDVIQDMEEAEMDDVIGRHISNNEEFDEAPESAHVKRSAQESFSPEAFILRRSLPWVDGTEAGLNFVAFGQSLDAFEAILHRMLGREDGIADALFQISRPVNGACFWCPPMKQAKLDLSLLGC
ncbi:MAG: Dyp-type peroxidase [Gammaproteobacteria bacterium]|nr:Dyp-type peroxidase [Gammaproteobacteria bacterium]